MSALRLTELHVGGVRCLSDVTISVPSAAPRVLFGGNGTGKSSVVEALQLLTRVGDGTFSMVQVGASSLLEHGASRITLGITASSGATEVRYQLRATATDGLAVDFEKVETVDASGQATLLLSRVEDTLEMPTVPEFARSVWLRPSHVALKDFGGHSEEPVFRQLVELICGIEVFAPLDTSPAWVKRGATGPRASANLEPAKRLAQDGHNLASAFHALRNELGDDHWNETMALVRAGLGQHIETVTTPADSAAGTLSLRLKYRGTSDQVPAVGISSGSLAYLGWVALVRLSADSGAVVIDDVDQGLHPRALTSVARMFEELAVKRPVIICTRSERFIASLRDPANAAHWLEVNDARRTRVRSPNPAALQGWVERLRVVDDCVLAPG